MPRAVEFIEGALGMGGPATLPPQHVVLVLDTSFHHETANASEEPRDVLIIDFWHPELSPAEVQALQFIYDLRYEYDRAIIEATSA